MSLKQRSTCFEWISGSPALQNVLWDFSLMTSCQTSMKNNQLFYLRFKLILLRWTVGQSRECGTAANLRIDTANTEEKNNSLGTLIIYWLPKLRLYKNLIFCDLHLTLDAEWCQRHAFMHSDSIYTMQVRASYDCQVTVRFTIRHIFVMHGLCVLLSYVRIIISISSYLGLKKNSQRWEFTIFR